MKKHQISLLATIAASLLVSGCGNTSLSSTSLKPDENAVVSATNVVTAADPVPESNSAVETSAPAGSSSGSTTSTTVSGTNTGTTDAAAARPSQKWLADPARYQQDSEQQKQNYNISVPILEYHETKYVPGNIATLRPSQLADEMKWLSTHGFHTINFGQLYAAFYYGYRLPSRPVLLTFDDGYESVYFNLMPLLKEYHYQATVFAVAGFTHKEPNRNKPFPTLTTGELRDMQESGLVDVENHTMTHKELPGRSAQAQQTEIAGAGRVLTDAVGHPMKYICYPNGSYDATTLSILKQSGYLLGVTQHQGYASLKQGPFNLSRLSVLSTTTPERFANMLAPSLKAATQGGRQAGGQGGGGTQAATQSAGATEGGTQAAANGDAQADAQANTKSEKSAAVQQVYQSGYRAFSSGDFATAIRLESDVLEKDASNAQAYSIRGLSRMYVHQYDSGMKDLNTALKLQPDDGYLRFNRALGLEVWGHFDDSITAYKYALQAPQKGWWNAWCDYGIASIYGRRGDVQHTVQYLKQAIALAPVTKTHAKTEQDFNPVRQSPEFQALIR